MLTIINSMTQPTQGLRSVSMVRIKSIIAFIEPSLREGSRAVPSILPVWLILATEGANLELDSFRMSKVTSVPATNPKATSAETTVWHSSTDCVWLLVLKVGV